MAERFYARPAFRAALWPGPFFWFYADDDIFWPTAYDDVFWTYGSPDIVAAILRPAAYARYGAPRHGIRPDRPLARDSGEPESSRLCRGDPTGLVNIAAIEQEVRPTPDQRAAFDELAAAEAKAVEILQFACATAIPQTAIGRLDTIAQRFRAMLDAVRTVGKPLETFYGSLSDEQKARFTALLAVQQREGTSGWQVSCSGRSPGPAAASMRSRAFTSVPVDQIGRELSLSDAQLAALGELSLASDEAASMLRRSCPTETPLTPTGRLAAIETRLDALLQAVDILRPALARFYGLLREEQKARFDAIGAARRHAG